MSETSKMVNFQSKIRFESVTLKASAMPPVRAAAYFGGLKMSESSKMLNFETKLIKKYPY